MPTLNWQIESRPQRKRPLRVVDDSNNGSAKYVHKLSIVRCDIYILFSSVTKTNLLLSSCVIVRRPVLFRLNMIFDAPSLSCDDDLNLKCVY